MRNLLLALLILTAPIHAQQRRPLGWKSDPNHSAGLKQLATHPTFRAAPLPAHASVEERLPDVYDQLNIGSCVANAGAAAFDYQWRTRTGKFVYPSRLDLYRSCLIHDGNYPQDTGTYTSTALKVLTLKGVLLEKKWPYNPDNLGAKPPNTGGQRAYYAAVKAYDISNTDNGYSVKQAIANAGLPVMAGGYVYNQIFEVTKSNPYIAMPRGGSVGGHEILFVAYDDNIVRNGQKGFVKIRNSWGKQWGNNGDAWMPYAYAFNPRQFEDFGAIEITGARVKTANQAKASGRFIEPKKIFLGEPLLVEEVAGSRRWKLMRDVIYETKNKEIITAKAGRTTDFASIPQTFWSILPPYDPRWGKAAVIHDELYSVKGNYPGRTYTRKEADMVFADAMKDLGAGYLVRQTMYNCVRMFNPEWNKKQVDSIASASIIRSDERSSRQTRKAGTNPARSGAGR